MDELKRENEYIEWAKKEIIRTKNQIRDLKIDLKTLRHSLKHPEEIHNVR